MEKNEVYFSNRQEGENRLPPLKKPMQDSRPKPARDPLNQNDAKVSVKGSTHKVFAPNEPKRSDYNVYPNGSLEKTRVDKKTRISNALPI